jgi:hypothetical protein
LAVTTSRGALRGSRQPSLGRIGLTLAYLLPALLIGLVVLARPSASQAALVGGECQDIEGFTFCEFDTSSLNPTTWFVPEGVTQVTIEAAGGQGGGENGGQGGSVTGTMDVEPGDAFSIRVGTWGDSEAPSSGGGGAGGAAAPYMGYATPAASPGQRGGGASSVTFEVEFPLIVAGGGGGASADGTAGGAGGGAPSTATAGAGTPATVGGGAAAGSGGSGTAGAGGVAFAYVPDNEFCPQPPGAHDDGLSGTAGSFASGGPGGAGYAGGGGGGGGFPAGGGGAGGWVCADDDNDVVDSGGSGGGGGGASWYFASLLSDVATEAGVNGGEGYVTISYPTPGEPEPVVGALAGSVDTFSDPAPIQPTVDLTAAGVTDWVVWGVGGATGSGLGKATGDDPASISRTFQTIGGISIGSQSSFGTDNPWRFTWSDGQGPEEATGVAGGVSCDSGVQPCEAGDGFTFTVAASTSPQRLRVYTHAHGGVGQLTATLSDGSASPFVSSHGSNGFNTPGVYTIDFEAGSAEATLTVSYVIQTVGVDGNGPFNNAGLHAATLAPQLVTNGGFERDVISAGGYVNRPAGSEAVPGWTVGLDGVDQVNDLEWAPFDGLQSIDLGSDQTLTNGGNGSVTQTIATEAGQTYLLSFAYGANPDGVGPSPTATASWGSEDFDLTPTRSPSDGAAWQTFSQIVTATGSSTDLSFVGVSGGLFGVTIDAVSVVPVTDTGSEEPTEVVAPTLLRAVPVILDGNVPGTGIVGLQLADPGTYDLDFYTSNTCVDGVLGAGPAFAGTFVVTTTATEPYFVGGFTNVGTVGDFMSVAINGPGDVVSDLSACVAVQPDNDSWVNALQLPLSGGSTTTNGWLDSEGNARWFKFSIVPGARVTVDLSSLPKDYDLFLFKDIKQAYNDLTTVQDLTRLTAEFAPSAFAPSAFAPSAFAPSAFAPSAFAPSAFAPSAFAPSAFAPSAFAPSAFAPSAFAPSAFAPSAFAPSAFAPSAFASAQTRSLISVSALPGTGNEWIIADTWNNTGDFYVRVSGKNGEFDTQDPFTLKVSIAGTDCVGISNPTGPLPTAIAGGYETLILTDVDRMLGLLPGNSATAKATMSARLATLAAAVDGRVVDVGADPRVTAMNDQADDEYACPYAKNLVASAIKDIVDAYRTANPDLQYIVIVGSDEVIPFFRYPDQSLLGPEQDYVPPVGGDTTSEASLRSNLVLGQDEYGAVVTISLRGATFPVPELAVGRLVETAQDVTTMVDAYLATTDGVVETPQSSLVTGYDFITDAASAIDAELTQGMGAGSRANTLITPLDLTDPLNPKFLSPEDPQSWTADQLRTAFLGQRNDITFLGGHFSASGALAADFRTEMRTSDLLASPVDFTNSIVFSIGCHSGYNLVDEHGIPGVTDPVDWAQAFARKGATLIAGTGYQYGDTDFLEYSERLYLEFSKQLRTGTGPVAVGDALVRAKLAYLAVTPDVRQLHEKSLIEAVVFGLPMLSVDMPGDRLPAPTGDSVVGTLQDYGSGPGAELDLDYFDLSTTASLAGQTKSLTNLDGGSDIVTKYFTGPQGVTTNPLEPALPLVVRDVTVPGKVLRGVGFIGGTYTEETVIPLTGAPNTEIRGVHIPFSSQVFFPIRPWTPNYFDALASDGGKTNLLITPVQHKSVGLGELDATARKFGSLQLRLFYSDNIETFGSGNDASTPALAAAPTITGVTASVDGQTITFRANVAGNPAAGIQEVWVTYTGHANEFQTTYLTQLGQSTAWEGRVTLSSSIDPVDLRFMVQAVNGVGLVSTADDFGALYRASLPGTGAPEASSLSLAGSATSGALNATVQVKATLTSDGPVAGKTILFVLGNAARVAVTDGSGVATAAMDVTATGPLQLTATFAGDDDIGASSASQAFAAAKASSSLTVTGPGVITLGSSGQVEATLQSGSTFLTGKSVLFKFVAPGGATTYVARETDVRGLATVPATAIPIGTHTVTASFGQIISVAGLGDLGVVDPAYSASSATTTYRVIWPFDGFFAPVDMPLVVNVATAGQSIPVRFSLGGDRGLSIFAAGFPKAVKVNCTTSTTDTVDETAAAGSSGLQYYPLTQRYTYVWKTDKKWKGSCYRLDVKLIDGETYSALFRFR